MRNPVSFETGFFCFTAIYLLFFHQQMTSHMQKSTKIAWTIVTILVGGIILWNLNTPTATGRAGYLIGLVMIVVIVGIWRWDSKEGKKDA